MRQILIALDQLCNACLFFLPGGAWADETLSARAWRCRSVGAFRWIRPMIDGLFFWQDNHCRSAFYAEMEREHSPKSLRLPHSIDR